MFRSKLHAGKRALCALVALALCISILGVPTVARAATLIDYFDENGAVRQIDQASATQITNGFSAPLDGWYYVSGTVATAGLAVASGETAYIILMDGCDITLTGASNAPGLQVEAGQSLYIYREAAAGTKGKLTAKAGTNGAGAGIGGGRNGDGGNITISGGTVTATAGDYGGAGIGGGMNGAGGRITIAGGEVTATGSDASGGAGIGGGRGGAGGDITISGGTVTATAGDYGGAGIGGGAYGAGGTITISGGAVTATGGHNGGAGIGGEGGGAGGNITITGGTVAATGGDGSAGIGGGIGCASGDIIISGGAQVSAIGGGSLSTYGGGAGVGSGGGNNNAPAGAVNSIQIEDTAYVYLDAHSSGGTSTNGNGAKIGYGGGGGGNGATKFTLFSAATSGRAGRSFKFVERMLTDAATGITVEGLIEKQSKLIVASGDKARFHEDCAACKEIRKLYKAGKLLGLYNIKLTLSYRGEVTLSIPVSSGAQKVTFLYCNGGRLGRVDAPVIGGVARANVKNVQLVAVMEN